MTALIPEAFVAVTPTMIRVYGAVPAIVLQFIHFATLADYIGGPKGECTLFHREIADQTGLSVDQVHRSVRRLEDTGVLGSDLEEIDGSNPQAKQRITYWIEYSKVPSPEGVPPRKRGGTSAKARRTSAKARRYTTPDVGKRTTEEVEECVKKSSSSTSDSRAAAESLDDDDFEAAADEAQAAPPPQPEPEPAEAGDPHPRAEPVVTLIANLLNRPATPSEQGSINTLLGRGWVPEEINRRLQHAAGPEVGNRAGYVARTLGSMLAEPAPAPPAAAPRSTWPAGTPPRPDHPDPPPRRPSDLGMSPPVGPQFGPDEGWDRWQYGAAGLAAARAALRPDRPPPDP